MSLLKAPEKDQMYDHEWEIIAGARLTMANNYKSRGNVEAGDNYDDLRVFIGYPYTLATYRVGIAYGRVYRIQSRGWVKI